MKVLKFGGTSVGSAEKIAGLLHILDKQERQIIVLSAVSGTTNALVEIGQAFLNAQKKEGLEKTNVLKEKYIQLIQELYTTEEGLEQATQLINHHFQHIEDLSLRHFGTNEDKLRLAEGEPLSSELFYYHLNEIDIESALIPSLYNMKTDEDQEPILTNITQNLGVLLVQYA